MHGIPEEASRCSPIEHFCLERKQDFIPCRQVIFSPLIENIFS